MSFFYPEMTSPPVDLTKKLVPNRLKAWLDRPFRARWVAQKATGHSDRTTNGDYMTPAFASATALFDAKDRDRYQAKIPAFPLPEN